MPVASENISILTTIQTFLGSLTADQQAGLNIDQTEINSGVAAIRAAVATADDEAEQILLRQIKDKNDLLQKTTERNKSLELLYKKTENDFKSYKKKISRLVES